MPTLKKLTMKLERFKENPFTQKFEVATTSKSVRVSPLGREDNVIVNQSTGEVLGTHVVAHKKVDSEKFVKVFAQNIAFQFDLTSAGIKALTVLIWTLQQSGINRDEIALDSFTLDDFIAAHANASPPLRCSLATFKRGLTELEKSKIIAKTLRKGRYFINPAFCFNGNRIVFSNVIERAEGDEHKQDYLPL